jgi:hypothetical protein
MKEIKAAALKTAEAAAYLGIGIGRVRELSDLGQIPCRKLNRERYFIVRELDQWIERQEKWVRNGNSETRGREMDCGLSPAAISRQ